MYKKLDNLPRFYKRLIILAVDVFLIPFCLYLAFSMRFGTLTPTIVLSEAWLLFPLLTVIGGFVAYSLGLPKIKLNTFETKAMLRIGICSFILGIAAIGLSYILALNAPRSVPMIFAQLYFLGLMMSRIAGLTLMNLLHDLGNIRLPVVIYGAGAAGIQLISALRQSREVQPVTFVDDNRALHGLIVAGLPVRGPDDLEKLVRDKKIGRVLLAMPSMSQTRRRMLVNQLDHLPCDVQALPSFIEMIDGTTLVESLRAVSPDDLLGRDKVDLDIPGVAQAYHGKSLLVSGAGGSIGSELCRQIMTCEPQKLVLFDHSELALYNIERELTPLAKEAGFDIIAVIGSVCDTEHMHRVLTDHSVQTVLHAAAYKHVPLVEANELIGLQNNVLGTKIIAEASRNTRVERFILVSTDKAVRPTNVMGASKRLAELLVQDLAIRSRETLFSMVRFGNVLGSSGSVIPLFRDQIAQGGPVTLTHEDVTRYFMTIPEAARLVLLAGSLARGGDVFALDMGKSIKIRDLARRMIDLSGRTLRDENNPDGDIEIVTTGLRPGEKLFEELLIGDDMLTTPHPKILRAQEDMLSELEIASALKDLRQAVDAGDANTARTLLARWVEGYRSPGQQDAI